MHPGEFETGCLKRQSGGSMPPEGASPGAQRFEQSKGHIPINGHPLGFLPRSNRGQCGGSDFTVNFPWIKTRTA